jgi:hypothetical protein
VAESVQLSLASRVRVGVCPLSVCLLAVGSDFGASCGPNAGDRGRRAIVGRESDGQ